VIAASRTFRGQNAINLLIAIAMVSSFVLFGFTRNDGRVLHHAWPGLCLGDAGDSDWLGRHARRHVVLNSYPLRRGHGLRSRHNVLIIAGTSMLFGVHSLCADVQGDEPLHHECLFGGFGAVMADARRRIPAE